MAHVQREDRLRKQRLQVVLQTLGTIQHDLHRLGRVRAEATLGRFRTRPQRRRLATRERGLQLLVDRPVQLAVVATLQACTSPPRSLPCRSCFCPLFSGVSCCHAPAASPCRDAVDNRTRKSFSCCGRRLPRRLANSASVAVGGHLPSTSITSTSPSFGRRLQLLHERRRLRVPCPAPLARSSRSPAPSSAPPCTPSATALKLMRVASRATHCITHGDRRSRVSPSTTSSGKKPLPPPRDIR